MRTEHSEKVVGCETIGAEWTICTYIFGEPELDWTSWSFFPQRMSITDYRFGTQSSTSWGKYYGLFKTHAIVSTTIVYLSFLGIAKSSIIIACLLQREVIL